MVLTVVKQGLQRYILKFAKPLHLTLLFSFSVYFKHKLQETIAIKQTLSLGNHTINK